MNNLDSLTQLAMLYVAPAAGATLTFAAFWIAGSMGKRAMLRLSRDAVASKQDVLRILAQGLKVALILVGAVSGLGTLGVNVGAMVAGLGLTGFALGFALKDVLSNVLSGMLILFYRPFARGDSIAVSGFEGRVASIDLRYTTLEGEKGRILIPNSVLFTNSIVVRRPQETT